MTTVAQTAAPDFSRYRWTILGVVIVGQVISSAFYLGWAAITPFLRNDFGLSREQVGMIVGATAGGASLSSMPLGRLSDRIGPRLTLSIGLAVMAVLSLLVTLSPSFGLLLPGVLLAGVAYGAINPTGIKVLVPWFPRRELGTAVALKQVGFPLGGALAALLLPALTLAFATWRLPLAGIGALTGVAAVGSLALVRDLPAGRSKPAGAGGQWWSPILRRNVLLLGAIGLLLAGVQSAWLGHLVLYSQEGLKLPVTVGAGFLAVSQVTAVFGRILVGVLSDRLLGGRRRELLGGAGLIAAGICAGLPLLVEPSPWLVSLLVVGFGLTGGSWPPLQLAALADEGGERSSGMTAGLGMACSGVGVMAAPTLFGRAVDTLGSYSPAWQGLAVLAVLAAGLTLMVRERGPLASVPTT